MVKIPRFAFEKFPGADTTLTTHMKSVGEVMALGRSFTEALQKARPSLEAKGAELDFAIARSATRPSWLADAPHAPHDRRLQAVVQAMRAGATSTSCTRATGIDPWFLDQLVLLGEVRRRTCAAAPALDATTLRTAKRHGFSDRADRRDPRRPERGRRPPAPPRARRPSGVQDRRHLRGGVRGAAPRTTTRSYDEEDEVEPRRPAEGAHPRQRTEPDRAGRGVRLLLCARLLSRCTTPATTP